MHIKSTMQVLFFDSIQYLGDLKKNDDFSFSENNLNIK